MDCIDEIVLVEQWNRSPAGRAIARRYYLIYYSDGTRKEVDTGEGVGPDASAETVETVYKEQPVFRALFDLLDRHNPKLRRLRAEAAAEKPRERP